MNVSRSLGGRPGTRLLATTVAMLACAQAQSAVAQQVRVWPSAVVVRETIQLGDLAELRGIESDGDQSLRNIIITDAPPAGGSRIIHHDMIRTALSTKGVNLARVTLSGSAQCEVRRPAALQQRIDVQPGGTLVTGAPSGLPATTTADSIPQQPGQTLRQVIQKYFDQEFARYGGRAEILFDRSDDRLLELTGPPLEFRVQREKSSMLGLCALEIDVVKDGKTAQRVPIVVRTALSRNVLTARRAINQDAAVVAADVDLMPVTFTRLDDLGLDDAALVLGQRAKRFIPAGTRIALETFEPVPLVLRGQLITLISEVGGVRVVTTAKAGTNGTRGETIRVRSVDDNKVEFDAVVTGPGEARAAGSSQQSTEESKPRFAAGVKQ